MMGKVGCGVGKVDWGMFAGDLGDVVEPHLGRLLMERLFKLFLEQVVDPSCFRLQSVGAVLDLFFIGMDFHDFPWVLKGRATPVYMIFLISRTHRTSFFSISATII